MYKDNKDSRKLDFWDKLNKGLKTASKLTEEYNKQKDNRDNKDKERTPKEIAVLFSKEAVKISDKRIDENKLKLQEIDKRNRCNLSLYNSAKNKTDSILNNLYIKELEIAGKFQVFISLFEKIKNKPDFEDIYINKINIPLIKPEEIKNISLKASTYIKSGALTVTGGVLANLAFNSVTGYLGTPAEKRKKIDNFTDSVPYMIFGISYCIETFRTGKKVQAAMEKMERSQSEINKVCSFLNSLNSLASKMLMEINNIDKVNNEYIKNLDFIINVQGKNNWHDFTDSEKLILKNTICLESVLYKIIQSKLIIENDNIIGQNKINFEEIDKLIKDSKNILISNNILMS